MRLYALFFLWVLVAYASHWFQSERMVFHGSLTVSDSSSVFSTIDSTASFHDATLTGAGQFIVNETATVFFFSPTANFSGPFLIHGCAELSSSINNIYPITLFIDGGYFWITQMVSSAHFDVIKFTSGNFTAIGSNKVHVNTLIMPEADSVFTGTDLIYVKDTDWTNGVIGANTYFTQSLELRILYHEDEEDYEFYGFPLDLRKTLDTYSNLVIQCNATIPTDTYLYFSEHSSLFVHESVKLVVGNTVNFSSLHEVNHALFINNGTLQLDISVFYLHPFFINHGIIDLRTCDQWILVLGGLFYQGNMTMEPSSTVRTFGDLTFRPPTVLHLAHCYLIQQNPEGVILIESSDVLFEDTFLGDTGDFYFANGTNVDPRGLLTCAGGRVFFMDTISTPYLFIDTLLIQGSWVYFYTHRDPIVSNLTIVSGFRAGSDFLTVDTLTWTTGGFRSGSKTLVKEWVRGPFGQDNVLRSIIEGSTLISQGNFHQQWRIEADTGSSLINYGSLSIFDNGNNDVTWHVESLDSMDNWPRIVNFGNITFGYNLTRQFVSSWVIDGEIPGEFFTNTSVYAKSGGIGNGMWDNAPDTTFTLGNHQDTLLDIDHYWLAVNNTIEFEIESFVFTNGTVCFMNTLMTGGGHFVLGEVSQICPDFCAILDGVRFSNLNPFPSTMKCLIINGDYCVSSVQIFSNLLTWKTGTLCSTPGNKATFITQEGAEILTQLPKAVGKDTTLILQGTTTVESDANVIMKPDSFVINEGLLELCTNSSFIQDSKIIPGENNLPTFINHGVLVKDCPGLSEISTPFIQSDNGTLIVRQGVLRLSGDSDIAGVIIVETGAYLEVTNTRITADVLLDGGRIIGDDVYFTGDGSITDTGVLVQVSTGLWRFDSDNFLVNLTNLVVDTSTGNVLFNRTECINPPYISHLKIFNHSSITVNLDCPLIVDDFLFYNNSRRDGTGEIHVLNSWVWYQGSKLSGTGSTQVNSTAVLSIRELDQLIFITEEAFLINYGVVELFKGTLSLKDESLFENHGIVLQQGSPVVGIADSLLFNTGTWISNHELLSILDVSIKSIGEFIFETSVLINNSFIGYDTNSIVVNGGRLTTNSSLILKKGAQIFGPGELEVSFDSNFNMFSHSTFNVTGCVYLHGDFKTESSYVITMNFCEATGNFTALNSEISQLTITASEDAHFKILDDTIISVFDIISSDSLSLYLANSTLDLFNSKIYSGTLFSESSSISFGDVTFTNVEATIFDSVIHAIEALIRIENGFVDVDDASVFNSSNSILSIGSGAFLLLGDGILVGEVPAFKLVELNTTDAVFDVSNSIPFEIEILLLKSGSVTTSTSFVSEFIWENGVLGSLSSINVTSQLIKNTTGDKYYSPNSKLFVDGFIYYKDGNSIGHPDALLYCSESCSMIVTADDQVMLYDSVLDSTPPLLWIDGEFFLRVPEDTFEIQWDLLVRGSLYTEDGSLIFSGDNSVCKGDSSAINLYDNSYFESYFLINDDCRLFSNSTVFVGNSNSNVYVRGEFAICDPGVVIITDGLLDLHEANVTCLDVEYRGGYIDFNPNVVSDHIHFEIIDSEKVIIEEGAQIKLVTVGLIIGDSALLSFSNSSVVNVTIFRQEGGTIEFGADSHVPTFNMNNMTGGTISFNDGSYVGVDKINATGDSNININEGSEVIFDGSEVILNGNATFTIDEESRAKVDCINLSMYGSSSFNALLNSTTNHGLHVCSLLMKDSSSFVSSIDCCLSVVDFFEQHDTSAIGGQDLIKIKEWEMYGGIVSESANIYVPESSVLTMKSPQTKQLLSYSNLTIKGEANIISNGPLIINDDATFHVFSTGSFSIGNKVSTEVLIGGNGLLLNHGTITIDVSSLPTIVTINSNVETFNEFIVEKGTLVTGGEFSVLDNNFVLEPDTSTVTIHDLFFVDSTSTFTGSNTSTFNNVLLDNELSKFIIEGQYDNTGGLFISNSDSEAIFKEEASVKTLRIVASNGQVNIIDSTTVEFISAILEGNSKLSVDDGTITTLFDQLIFSGNSAVYIQGKSEIQQFRHVIGSQSGSLNIFETSKVTLLDSVIQQSGSSVLSVYDLPTFDVQNSSIDLSNNSEFILYSSPTVIFDLNDLWLRNHAVFNVSCAYQPQIKNLHHFGGHRTGNTDVFILEKYNWAGGKLSSHDSKSFTYLNIEATAELNNSPTGTNERIIENHELVFIGNSKWSHRDLQLIDNGIFRINSTSKMTADLSQPVIINGDTSSMFYIHGSFENLKNFVFTINVGTDIDGSIEIKEGSVKTSKKVQLLSGTSNVIQPGYYQIQSNFFVDSTSTFTGSNTSTFNNVLLDNELSKFIVEGDYDNTGGLNISNSDSEAIFKEEASVKTLRIVASNGQVNISDSTTVEFISAILEGNSKLFVDDDTITTLFDHLIFSGNSAVYIQGESEIRQFRHVIGSQYGSLNIFKTSKVTLLDSIIQQSGSSVLSVYDLATFDVQNSSIDLSNNSEFILYSSPTVIFDLNDLWLRNHSVFNVSCAYQPQIKNLHHFGGHRTGDTDVFILEKYNWAGGKLSSHDSKSFTYLNMEATAELNNSPTGTNERIIENHELVFIGNSKWSHRDLKLIDNGIFRINSTSKMTADLSQPVIINGDTSSMFYIHGSFENLKNLFTINVDTDIDGSIAIKEGVVKTSKKVQLLSGTSNVIQPGYYQIQSNFFVDSTSTFTGSNTTTFNNVLLDNELSKFIVEGDYDNTGGLNISNSDSEAIFKEEAQIDTIALEVSAGLALFTDSSSTSSLTAVIGNTGKLHFESDSLISNVPFIYLFGGSIVSNSANLVNFSSSSLIVGGGEFIISSNSNSLIVCTNLELLATGTFTVQDSPVELPHFCRVEIFGGNFILEASSFDLDSIIVIDLLLAGGTRKGLRTLNITEKFIWESGTLMDATETRSLTFASIGTTAEKTLQTLHHLILFNQTLFTGGLVHCYESSIIINKEYSTFTINGDGVFEPHFSSVIPVLHNEVNAEIVKYGCNMFVMDIALQNEGIFILVDPSNSCSGRNIFAVGRDSWSSGIMQIEDFTTLELLGVFITNQTSNIYGAGNVQLSTSDSFVAIAGTFNITGSVIISADDAEIQVTSQGTIFEMNLVLTANGVVDFLPFSSVPRVAVLEMTDGIISFHNNSVVDDLRHVFMSGGTVDILPGSKIILANSHVEVVNTGSLTLHSFSFSDITNSTFILDGLAVVHVQDECLSSEAVFSSAEIRGGNLILDSSNPMFVSVLEMSGGSRSGSGYLEVTEELIWQGGSFIEAGITRNMKQMTVAGTSLMTINLNHTLENYGHVSLLQGELQAGVFTRMINMKSGIFEIGGQGQLEPMVEATGLALPVFINHGEFAKISTSDTFDFLLSMQNQESGIIIVENGTLSVGTDSFSKGILRVDQDCTFEITGNFVFENSSRVLSSPGTIHVSQPTSDVSISGLFDHSGILLVSNGLVEFSNELLVESAYIVQTNGLVYLQGIINNLAIDCRGGESILRQNVSIDLFHTLIVSDQGLVDLEQGSFVLFDQSNWFISGGTLELSSASLFSISNVSALITGGFVLFEQDDSPSTIHFSNLTLCGGVLDVYSVHNPIVDYFYLCGGTRSGSANMDVNELFSWTAGSLTGLGSTTLYSPSYFSDSTPKSLSEGHSLINYNNMVIDNTEISLYNGSKWINELPSGTILLVGDVFLVSPITSLFEVSFINRGNITSEFYSKVLIDADFYNFGNLDLLENSIIDVGGLRSKSNGSIIISSTAQLSIHGTFEFAPVGVVESRGKLFIYSPTAKVLILANDLLFNHVIVSKEAYLLLSNPDSCSFVQHTFMNVSNAFVVIEHCSLSSLTLNVESNGTVVFNATSLVQNLDLDLIEGTVECGGSASITVDSAHWSLGPLNSNLYLFSGCSLQGLISSLTLNSNSLLLIEDSVLANEFLLQKLFFNGGEFSYSDSEILKVLHLISYSGIRSGIGELIAVNSAEINSLKLLGSATTQLSPSSISLFSNGTLILEEHSLLVKGDLTVSSMKISMTSSLIDLIGHVIIDSSEFVGIDSSLDVSHLFECFGSSIVSVNFSASESSVIYTYDQLVFNGISSISSELHLESESNTVFNGPVVINSNIILAGNLTGFNAFELSGIITSEPNSFISLFGSTVLLYDLSVFNNLHVISGNLAQVSLEPSVILDSLLTFVSLDSSTVDYKATSQSEHFEARDASQINLFGTLSYTLLLSSDNAHISTVNNPTLLSIHALIVEGGNVDLINGDVNFQDAVILINSGSVLIDSNSLDMFNTVINQTGGSFSVVCNENVSFDLIYLSIYSGDHLITPDYPVNSFTWVGGSLFSSNMTVLNSLEMLNSDSVLLENSNIIISNNLIVSDSSKLFMQDSSIITVLADFVVSSPLEISSITHSFITIFGDLSINSDSIIDSKVTTHSSAFVSDSNVFIQDFVNNGPVYITESSVEIGQNLFINELLHGNGHVIAPRTTILGHLVPDYLLEFTGDLYFTHESTYHYRIESIDIHSNLIVDGHTFCSGKLLFEFEVQPFPTGTIFTSIIWNSFESKFDYIDMMCASNFEIKYSDTELFIMVVASVVPDVGASAFLSPYGLDTICCGSEDAPCLTVSGAIERTFNNNSLPINFDFANINMFSVYEPAVFTLSSSLVIQVFNSNISISRVIFNENFNGCFQVSDAKLSLSNVDFSNSKGTVINSFNSFVTLKNITYSNSEGLFIQANSQSNLMVSDLEITDSSFHSLLSFDSSILSLFNCRLINSDGKFVTTLISSRSDLDSISLTNSVISDSMINLLSSSLIFQGEVSLDNSVPPIIVDARHSYVHATGLQLPSGSTVASTFINSFSSSLYLDNLLIHDFNWVLIQAVSCPIIEISSVIIADSSCLLPFIKITDCLTTFNEVLLQASSFNSFLFGQKSFITVNSSHFNNNDGVLFEISRNSEFILSSSLFDSNIASPSLISSTSSHIFHVSNNTFKENSGDFGGSILTKRSLNVIISDNVFINNRGFIGGALFISNNVSNNYVLEISYNYFKYNEAERIAGAVYCDYSKLPKLDFLNLFQDNSVISGYGPNFASNSRKVSATLLSDSLIDFSRKISVSLLDGFNQTTVLSTNKPSDHLVVHSISSQLSLQGDPRISSESFSNSFVITVTARGPPNVYPLIISLPNHIEDVVYIETSECEIGEGIQGGSCQFCSDHTYSHNSKCLPCPEGQHSFVPSDHCSHCLPGTYRPFNSTSGCQPCPHGTVSSSHGASQCLSCPDSMTNNEDKTQCECKPNFMMNDDGVCTTCPVGILCFGGDEICVLPGFYQGINELYKVYHLGSRGNCLDGQVPGEGVEIDSVCKENHGGHLCLECTNQSYLIGGQCVSCSSDPINWLILTSSVVVIVGFIYGILKFGARMGTTLIVFRFIQSTVAILVMSNVTIHSKLLPIYGALQTIFLDVFKSISLNCLGIVSGSYSIKILGSVGISVVLLLILFIMKPSSLDSSIPSKVFSNQVLLVVLLFLIPSLANSLFGLFSCIEVDGIYIVEADASENILKCFTSDWWMLVGLAVLTSSISILMLSKLIKRSSVQEPGTRSQGVEVFFGLRSRDDVRFLTLATCAITGCLWILPGLLRIVASLATVLITIVFACRNSPFISKRLNISFVISNMILALLLFNSFSVQISRFSNSFEWVSETVGNFVLGLLPLIWVIILILQVIQSISSSVVTGSYSTSKAGFRPNSFLNPIVHLSGEH
ncbi:hypothetical protein RCL1_003585 [Eukaryota sp. TZLM3-RCL]